MIKTRIKESKKEILRKCVFKCDRNEKANNNDETDKRFYTSSKLIDCSFNAVALLQNDY